MMSRYLQVHFTGFELSHVVRVQVAKQLNTDGIIYANCQTESVMNNNTKVYDIRIADDFGKISYMTVMVPKQAQKGGDITPCSEEPKLMTAKCDCLHET